MGKRNEKIEIENYTLSFVDKLPQNILFLNEAMNLPLKMTI